MDYFVDRQYGSDAYKGDRLHPFATLKHAKIISKPEDRIFIIVEYKDTNTEENKK